MASFNLTSASGVFKTKYVRLSRDMYNSDNVVQAKVKKTYEFVGDEARIAVPTTFTGGIGAGSLPTANAANYSKMTITAKKMYGVIQIDRETIKAASTDEGAFVRATKEQVKRCVQAWNRNLSRAMFNSLANGALGLFDATPTGTAAAPIVVITAASWKQANWEPKDYINFGTDSSVFEITAVAPSTRTVTLARISGSLDLTGQGSGTFYMQNSKDNDPTSFASVVEATSSTLYGINVGYRWQSPSQIAAGGAPLTVDLLNQQMLDVKYNFGETPNLIVMSFVQYRKLLNQIEDQKRYTIVESRESGPKGKFSFRALEFMSDAGPVPVVAERFVEDDRVYCMNTDYIEIMHRPDFGWVDDDGTVFLRDAGSDSFSARYAGYLEIVSTPTAHGYIDGLAT
jgi:hypothetical protein